MTNRINITKPILPEREIFDKYIDEIFSSNWLTNFGPVVSKFEQKITEFLNVKYLLPVSNGTLALQIAFKLLDLKGEVITTPFSFIATTSSLLWNNLTPVFVDINPKTLTIDVDKIEEKITKNTTGILPVNVFGNVCDVEQIDIIAKKHNLKVVYDSAHAFGVKYKNNSILNFGDISILSFHATKLFHTIEGGALVFKDKKLYEKAKSIINFGINKNDIDFIGINAKMNEFQAAMGLSLFEDIEKIIIKRKQLFETYEQAFENTSLKMLKWDENITKNYSYFPILFETEKKLLETMTKLNQNNIFPRRYFYPSLNLLKFLKNKQECFVSEDISKRILCLPLYPDLKKDELKFIIKLILEDKQ